MDVRLAVVGTSWIAGALVDAARTVPGVEVVGVYSRRQESATRFAERYGIPRTFTDLTALGQSADVEAAYIASPNSLHAPQAITLLEAGTHVLVEKPLAASAAQAEAMIAAARANGRVLMEAWVAPFEPNVAALREALPRVGHLRRVLLTKSQYSSKYDALKAGELPNAFNPAFAGGSLMDLGIYEVSLAIHLFGEPASVLASGLVLPSGVDGQGTVLLRYEGFDVLCIHSKITPTATGSEISGEDGVLAFDDCSVPTRVALISRLGSPGEATAAAFTRPPGTPEDLTRPQSSHHMRYEVEEFAAVIRRGALESSLHPPANSLAALRILDQARRWVGVRFPSDL